MTMTRSDARKRREEPIDGGEIDGPPRKRLAIEIHISAHTGLDGIDALDDIARDLERGDLEHGGRVVSSRGWSLTVTEVDPSMTPERYERELAEWFAARRAAREAKS